MGFATAMRERSERQHGRRSLVPKERAALLDPFPDFLRLPDDTAPEPDRVTIRPGGVDVTLAEQPVRPAPPRAAGRARVLLTIGTSVDDTTLVHTLAGSIAETGADVLVTATPEHVAPHPRVLAVGFTPLHDLLPDVDARAAGQRPTKRRETAGDEAHSVPSARYPVEPGQRAAYADGMEHTKSS